MTSQAGDRWSIPLGNWQGMPARLHLSMLLLIVGVMAVAFPTHPAGAAIVIGVVLVSALLHEAAHHGAASWLRGDRQPLILTPIGGLRLPQAPGDPEAQLLVAMVGPMANLSIVVVTTAALAFSGENLTGLFAVFKLDGLLEGSLLLVALKAALWVNWVTFLLSLLPAYPFDGGPALRASLWPLLGQRSAAAFTAHAGRIVGVLLAIASVAFLRSAPEQALAMAAPLGALAVLVLCSAQHDLQHGHSHGGEIGSHLLEESPLRIKARQAGADSGGVPLDGEYWGDDFAEDAEEELNEDNAVDAILARLHRHGPQDLSEEDRRVLDRASRRYRSRRGRASSE